MSFSEFEDCFVWSCDKCGLAVEFPATSFWSAHGELKARGWRFIREYEGSWSHYCSKCKQQADAGILDRKIRSVGR
jgi:hypothetical protein